VLCKVEDAKEKFGVFLLYITYRLIQIITTFNWHIFCLFLTPNFNKINQQLYYWSLTTKQCI